MRLIYVSILGAVLAITSCDVHRDYGSGQQYVLHRPGQKVQTPDNQNSGHTGPSYFDQNFPLQRPGEEENTLRINSYGPLSEYDEHYYNRFNEYNDIPASPLTLRDRTEIPAEDSLYLYVYYPDINDKLDQIENERRQEPLLEDEEEDQRGRKAGKKLEITLRAVNAILKVKN